MIEYISRLPWALYLSEGWYDSWYRTRKPYAKARAMVLFDRVSTGRIKRGAMP